MVEYHDLGPTPMRKDWILRGKDRAVLPLHCPAMVCRTSAGVPDVKETRVTRTLRRLAGLNLSTAPTPPAFSVFAIAIVSPRTNTTPQGASRDQTASAGRSEQWYCPARENNVRRVQHTNARQGPLRFIQGKEKDYSCVWTRLITVREDLTFFSFRFEHHFCRARDRFWPSFPNAGFCPVAGPRNGSNPALFEFAAVLASFDPSSRRPPTQECSRGT